mmetsp:Transcript_21738/g.51592  ORF Transcript_21738/g.51592 Transcript_21738/m.51592 type:complete len:125 (+) Transcript_21738:1391-1765(+)|eukprot:326291-Rhodomonas_salina.2
MRGCLLGSYGGCCGGGGARVCCCGGGAALTGAASTRARCTDCCTGAARGELTLDSTILGDCGRVEEGEMVRTVGEDARMGTGEAARGGGAALAAWGAGAGLALTGEEGLRSGGEAGRGAIGVLL